MTSLTVISTYHVPGKRKWYNHCQGLQYMKVLPSVLQLLSASLQLSQSRACFVQSQCFSSWWSVSEYQQRGLASHGTSAAPRLLPRLLHWCKHFIPFSLNRAACVVPSCPWIRRPHPAFRTFKCRTKPQSSSNIVILPSAKVNNQVTKSKKEFPRGMEHGWSDRHN